MSLPIPRATVEDMEAHRARALALYGDAFDKLTEATVAAGSAAHGQPFGPVLAETSYGNARTFGASDRDKFLDHVRQGVDRAIWSHMMQATNLERLMDRTARDQFRDQLAKDPPPATADNLFATMERLVGDAGLIFARGVAEAFSKLDRRFRSHDGFKIGGRVCLSNAFTDTGGWNYYAHRDEDLRDVERAFYVLDGKPTPERSGGIIGAIGAARTDWRPCAYVAEDDYFRAKVFKNGNLHVHFKRDDLLEKVNGILATYYGAALGARTEMATREHAPRQTPAKNFGDFQSPPAVIDAVMEHARIGAGMMVLEPSAGLGGLALAAEARGGDVTCIEVQPRYLQSLKARGFRAYGEDFLLSRVAPLFDRVVMNPPFDGGRDIDHVTHALKALKIGGRLVSVMAAGVEFREDAKARDFRAMVERHGGRFYDLPARSFESVGTNVNTVLLVISK